MSHFYVWVLVPKATKPDAIEDVVSTLLAPFDENLEVPEYDKECWCIGSKARLAGADGANEKVGHFGAIRDAFHARADIKALVAARSAIYAGNRKPTDAEKVRHRELGDEWDREWKAHTAAWNEANEAIAAAHPLFGKASPGCSDCKGTGVYRSTYNPQSKWDWWRIGGRWDGVIRRAERDSEDGGFNFGDDHAQPKHNVIAVGELLPLRDDDVPFAIVTPDGEWAEKGRMGWWANVSDEKADWKDQAKKIAERHADCLAVGCDLHI